MQNYEILYIKQDINKDLIWECSYSAAINFTPVRAQRWSNFHNTTIII